MELGEEQGEDPDCIDGLEKLMIYINSALDDDGVRKTEPVSGYTVKSILINQSICRLLNSISS